MTNLSPAAQAPTDQDLLRLYQVATPCYHVEECKRELDFARAVLARWGNPAPVPVSERLRAGGCQMTDLSPAAQAVRDAALATYDKSIPRDDSLWALDRASVAAALRAAADQVVPEYETTPGGSKIWPSEPVPSIRAALLVIAEELEAATE